ncbi:MAG TPA: hypothetical protein VGK97_02030 [Spongiibacteraceae bacterium]|jgi:hypothetical protein
MLAAARQKISSSRLRDGFLFFDLLPHQPLVRIFFIGTVIAFAIYEEIILTRT